jgi:hypothetical protein
MRGKPLLAHAIERPLPGEASMRSCDRVGSFAATGIASYCAARHRVTFRRNSLTARPSAFRRAKARAACMLRSRPGMPARAAISVAVEGSSVSAARTRGRTSMRGRAPRGEGFFGMAVGLSQPHSQDQPEMRLRAVKLRDSV